MKKSKNHGRILTRSELRLEMKILKSKKKKIVFTNGCFELLHLGHIDLFKKAKDMGDILIVAINSDKSVSYIKGSKRPIVSDKDRAKLLLSLKYIDYVVIFNEKNPNKILKELRPDILVKGSDYQLSKIVGKEYAKKVYRFPIVKGKSTTNLINLILNKYGYQKINEKIINVSNNCFFKTKNTKFFYFLKKLHL
ncbi:MAG: adenylyltransferase/cytidyltransferase family protein [Endomicrobium sp.]|jgi:D-beta-D-heptose 7-phosphate kinase/D-beta-D-heptose 1-phosphate adenosyltransferase|nr:adenylyltransferase/cytidyltransferase family protein [Endomicrobium sp.]